MPLARCFTKFVSKPANRKTSVRKWKEKLKEWKFEKNVSASDMTIVLAKAEKRAREEGKETAIFHGGNQITKERIEQFKRRKTFREEVMMSPSAGRFSHSA